MEADIAGLRRQVQNFDYDLQDAINGFYRRRQADRMREIRETEQKKKPLSWNQLAQRALEKTMAGLGEEGDRPLPEETPSETSTNQG